MSDRAYRPRSATEIVDGTFRLYREHASAFLTLSTLAYLPIIALVIPILWAMSGSTEHMGLVGFAGFGLVVVALVWYPMVWGALQLSVSEHYLGREIDTGVALARSFAKFGSVLGSWYAKWIIVMIGFFLAIVPGFYFLARFFAVPATVLLEGQGVGTALGRSGQLAIGHKWRILGTMALSWLILVAISIAASMIVLIVMGIAFAKRGPEAMTPSSSLLTQLPTLFAYIVGMPITVIVHTLLYYDARIRQEGFDIEIMSQQLEDSGMKVPAH